MHKKTLKKYSLYIQLPNTIFDEICNLSSLTDSNEVPLHSCICIFRISYIFIFYWIQNNYLHLETCSTVILGGIMLLNVNKPKGIHMLCVKLEFTKSKFLREVHYLSLVCKSLGSVSNNYATKSVLHML